MFFNSIAVNPYYSAPNRPSRAAESVRSMIESLENRQLLSCSPVYVKPCAPARCEPVHCAPVICQPAKPSRGCDTAPQLQTGNESCKPVKKCDDPCKPKNRCDDPCDSGPVVLTKTDSCKPQKKCDDPCKPVKKCDDPCRSDDRCEQTAPTLQQGGNCKVKFCDTPCKQEERCDTSYDKCEKPAKKDCFSSKCIEKSDCHPAPRCQPVLTAA